MTVYDYNFDLAIREDGEQVVVTNNLGRTAIFGEFVYLDGRFGYVSEFAGIANAAIGRIQLVDKSHSISTSQIEATNTLVVGNDLYFVSGGSSAAGKITNIPAAGGVYIGKVEEEFGAGGAQTAVRFRPVSSVLVTGGNSGSVKVARVIIDAATDYSTTGKATGVPIGSTILDVLAIATATHTSGTAQVVVGTTSLHTALVMAADGVLTRMAAAVDDSKLVVDAAVTVKTAAIGDAGIVEIFYI